jgi:hypothetical protein
MQQQCSAGNRGVGRASVERRVFLQGCARMTYANCRTASFPVQEPRTSDQD